jgi:hypothetical protein
MKKNLLFVLSIAVTGLLLSAVVFAQDDRVVSAAGDMYVISAKAGGVNHVEGKVSVARKNGTSGYLIKDDKLEIGEKVITGADGKAEILLNPGSFVRLGGNSGFEFVTTDLDNLKLKLTSGSAILEVYADDEFKVTVAIPKADIELTRSGVYRIDVRADGSGRISVWKGRVFVGDDQAEVKSGRSAIVSGVTATVSKFDRDNKDELDIWSQNRAKEAAKINARLQRDRLRNTLLNSFNRGGWNLYNSFGLWVFDPFTRRWCFLPFGQGWDSPYGYGYGFDLWYCRLPRYIYTQPPPPPPTTGGGNTSQNPTNVDRRNRLQTPTFQRFENNQRGSGGSSGGGNQSDNGGIFNDRKNDSYDRRNDSNDTKSDSQRTPPPPVYVPPPSPPPSSDVKGKRDN